MHVIYMLRVEWLFLPFPIIYYKKQITRSFHLCQKSNLCPHMKSLYKHISCYSICIAVTALVVATGLYINYKLNCVDDLEIGLNFQDTIVTIKACVHPKTKRIHSSL